MSNIDKLCKLIRGLGYKAPVESYHRADCALVRIPKVAVANDTEFTASSVDYAAGMALGALRDAAMKESHDMRHRADAICEALGMATSETIARDLLARAAAEHDRVEALMNRWKAATAHSANSVANAVAGCAKELEQALVDTTTNPTNKEPTGRITTNPEVCGGQPCVRGMGIPVSLVLKHLAAGRTAEQIVDEFPELELEDVLACLLFAAERLSHDPSSVVNSVPCDAAIALP